VVSEVLTAPKNFEMQLPFMDANASVKLSTSQLSGVDLIIFDPRNPWSSMVHAVKLASDDI
jgi:hypothetical protein